MTEHPKYHIKKLSDFLEIPPEKLAHAMKDFHHWISFIRLAQDVLKETPGVEIDVSQFIWVDDGLHEMIPVFEIKEPAEKVKP